MFCQSALEKSCSDLWSEEGKIAFLSFLTNNGYYNLKQIYAIFQVKFL